MIVTDVLKLVILFGFLKGSVKDMPLKINSEKLKELLMDFYILTKIRIVLFDNEFNKIMSYPEKECDFCTLIKSNEKAKKECLQSDLHAFQTCCNTKKLYMYKCHAGLIEVATPIQINDIVLGYVMFGQIIDKSNKTDEKMSVLKRCLKYNLDNEKLATIFDKLTSKSKEQIKAASKILESCACYLWISELVKIGNESLFLKIDKFIDKNIKEDITIKMLCDRFSVSRSKLYEISNKYFGMGISQYIRKKRIHLAISVLEKENCTMNEVCTLVGINDYNYFSKMFKKETGLSPRFYLKNIQC